MGNENAVEFKMSDRAVQAAEKIMKRHAAEMARIAKDANTTLSEKCLLATALVTRDPDFEKCVVDVAAEQPRVALLVLGLFMTGCYIYGIATM